MKKIIIIAVLLFTTIGAISAYFILKAVHEYETENFILNGCVN